MRWAKKQNVPTSQVKTGSAQMPGVKTLYEQDFVLWAKEQAAALRSAARHGSNQNLDWENLTEEMESLGIPQLRELKSQIRRVC
jgi:hypothetical protein